MELGRFALLCAVILTAAVLLDLALILALQRRRRRQADGRSPLEAHVDPDVASSEVEARAKRDLFEAALRFWKTELWSDDRRAMQFVVAVACLFITVSIGYVYAPEEWVEGWQLWAWAICVITVVLCLMPAGRPPFPRSERWRWLLVLGLAALLLRIIFLEDVPGGLHQDEVAMADFALRSVFPEPHRTYYPFRTGVFSQPVLYNYVIRLSLALFGNSITGLRIPSVLAGSLAVLATYAVVAVFQNRRTAWLSAIIMTTYHYHVHWSRLGLNNVWDTLWVPLMLAAFAWGWRRRWSGGAVLTGLILGLSQYFYHGSKIGALLLVYVVFWLWRQERDGRRLIVHVGKLFLTATCIAAPVALFALRNPDPFFERSRVVFGWQLSAIAEGTAGRFDVWNYVCRQAWRTVGAFTSVPDITGFYGPGVPLVIGLAAPLFVIGVLWSLRKCRLVPVLWILLTVLLGGFMLNGAPSSSHYAVSIPAICWLIAVPLDWLMETGRRRLALLLLPVVVITDSLFYFAVYVPGGPCDLIHPFPSGPFP